MHSLSLNTLVGAALALCCTQATAWKFVTNGLQYLKPGFEKQFLEIANLTGHGSIGEGIHVRGIEFGNPDTDTWAHDFWYPNNASTLLGLDLPPALPGMSTRQADNEIEFACGEPSCEPRPFANVEDWEVYKSVTNIICGTIERAAIPAGIVSLGIFLDGRICRRAGEYQYPTIAVEVGLSNIQGEIVDLFDEQVCQQILAEPANQACSGSGHSKTCQVRNDNSQSGQLGLSVQVEEEGWAECHPSETHHCTEVNVDV